MEKTTTKKFYVYSHSSVPWQQKIIKDFLKMTLIKKGCRCLDAGCGIGNNLPTLLKFSKNIFACDIYDNAISYSKEKHKNAFISFIKADINQIPFPSNYFDIIICTEVIEHIDNPTQTIKELFRVLKNNSGYLIISSPNYFNLAGIVKFFADKISGKKTWNVWGTNPCGTEYFMTWRKLKKLLSAEKFKIIDERGGDFLNSWLLFLPFVFRNFKYTDKLPFLWLGKIPFLKILGMNYFILAKTN